MIGWFKRRHEAAAVAEADAEALMIAKGGGAYAEARRRERVSLIGTRGPHDPRKLEHWRRVATIIAEQATANA